MSIDTHICHHVGLCMEKAEVEELPKAGGGTYYKAVAKIHSIFGADVNGECEGIGSTREQALARLNLEVDKLAESLWEE